MNQLTTWNSPELKPYGSVEKITEQNQVGSVTKSGGTGDTITITIGGVTSTAASGAAAGSSLINITPQPSPGGGPC